MPNAMDTMDGMAPPSSSSVATPITSEVTNEWPSGDSTTSLTMDDEDVENVNESTSRKYERKTRRFAWPDELHRLFVAAIFDLGLKNASPKALLPFMEPTATSAGVTTEHLKSHLQKYRLNYDKSRGEFLAFFDESARRNGRRRRRSAKSTESHTRFIFPITPCPPDDPSLSGQSSATTPPHATSSRADAESPPSPTSVPFSYSQVGGLSPHTSFDRASLLRLAQHNAALAFASQAAAPGDGTPSADAVTDAQWRMLASLLSPQVDQANGASTPTGFSLNDELSPDMQLQMHLAMQAQVNLHRQMLTRKVAVSQNYYSQAAAVKRAAASAMVERALQNHQQQQQPHYNAPARYNAMPSAQPSIGDEGNHAHPQYQQQQQQMLFQQQQRYPVTSSRADALLGPPWDPMDVDMSMQAEDQADLFSFLKTNE